LYGTSAATCGLFLLLTTFSHVPNVLVVFAVGGSGLIALNRGFLPALTITELAALVVATGAGLVFSLGDLILWKYVYWFVPGGAAIRVSSRVCLITLIPLSVGFAKFWEWLVNRADWRYATPLAVFCLLEQGMSTTSFDKQDTRQRVRTVGSWVLRDGKPRAFFYSSLRPGPPDSNDHVDAMWAGLETDVPTVNGYSSSSPLGWRSLYASAITDGGGQKRVLESLRHWTRLMGLPIDEVAWVHDGRRLPTHPLGGSDRSTGPTIPQ
jgi:hypothetical protein